MVTSAKKLQDPCPLEEKIWQNLYSVLKSRDITLPTKVRIVKAMVFPVVMYRCENWIMKRTECQRIDAFELWCWIRLLSVPWTDSKEIKPVNPKGNMPWIFIRRTDAEAKSPILWRPDAKSQLTGKRPWCWERLKAGGEGDDRGGDGWMASSTQWTWVWAGSGSWWWTGKPGVLQSMGLQRVGHDWVTTTTDGGEMLSTTLSPNLRSQKFNRGIETDSTSASNQMWKWFAFWWQGR